ncbi:tyrosine-type recombinase/integrase [Roseiconus lacunae]|uniref:tyrosine-type recombinase/integrase n=1 Tax=Roseiconus lacunae TaxID=2605694 RepID=UPI0011F39F82
MAVANPEGEQFDFHALRHTCGAWLAQAGENPKTIKTIMRHSSITLTMDTYGHLFPAAESDAIARLSDRHFNAVDMQ